MTALKKLWKTLRKKVSVFGVILVRIQSEYGKMRSTITPNTDTFHAVKCSIFLSKTLF